MKYNKDFTDEDEAEKAWIKNIKKLAEAREANPEFDEALNMLLSGGMPQAGGEEEGGEEEGE